MNIKIKSIALATITYVLSTGMTQAALITTNTLSVTDDFNNFVKGNTIIYSQLNGQVALASGAILSSTSNNSFIGDNNGLDYSLFNNGSWNAAGRDGFAALSDDSGTMTFVLPYEVNYVGGFMNYSSPLTSGTNVIISAFDSLNNELVSYTLNTEAAISTSGTNEGAFRGILWTDPLIKTFQISNSYVVLDDLTFGTAAVPVPAAMWLFGSGLLGLVAVARRKVRA